MTIRHHPSEESLLRHAAGTLGAGPTIVVATHLATCPACRSHVADLEAAGGVLLESLTPTPLAPDAVAAALARIDAAPQEPIVRPPATTLPGPVDLPAPLHAFARRPWRWLGPGIRCSRVVVPNDPSANVMLYRIGPNRRLPEHGHTGTEFTQVISGSFSDARGRYGPGDLVEADGEIEHQPVVDADGECICLAALDGRMILRGFAGRLLQTFVDL
jgi:putative transcriptional regulator